MAYTISIGASGLQRFYFNYDEEIVVGGETHRFFTIYYENSAYQSVSVSDGSTSYQVLGVQPFQFNMLNHNVQFVDNYEQNGVHYHEFTYNNINKYYFPLANVEPLSLSVALWDVQWTTQTGKEITEWVQATRPVLLIGNAAGYGFPVVTFGWRQSPLYCTGLFVDQYGNPTHESTPHSGASGNGWPVYQSPRLLTGTSLPDRSVTVYNGKLACAYGGFLYG